ncbi:FadR/GntR family transcriptional regulator [Nocardioides sp. KR10-350]|uniref:FadR/GntR family transcriptional regulator n=1 Tax=Nocardioides cheoyonin TaxID=3156615 RepID=UPI0032B4181B
MSRTSPFRQVRPVRLYQNIVDQIEGAISRGELKPGERLPSERELVGLFGASRPTVREALRVLEANGVVRSRPGDPNGPEVLPFSSAGLAKQMTRLAQLEELSIGELIAFRMIIDGSASMLAAYLRSPEELAAMQATLVAMEGSIEVGYDAFSAADLDFHDAIAQASRNRMIQICNAVVRDVVLQLIEDKVSHALDSEALMRESLAHHREVLAAIGAGDGEGAARISRRKLYDYYAGYVPEGEQATMLALLED